ncbi:MAG: hypothetical protein ACR2RL_21625 [Gammaproteobacteria bacterium]
MLEATSPEAPVATLPAVANPLDLSTEVFMAGLERRGENRAALLKWVGDALVRGVDYDRIHVMSKDKCNLGKRCTTHWHFSKDTLFKPGAEKICGMLGLRVSYPTLPDYEQAAIGGQSIHTIILRCELLDASGNVVAHGIGGRLVKDDYGNINKSLKMAAKSAHLDATLRCAGLSEMFTQDLDDMVPADAGPVRGAQTAERPGDSGRDAGRPAQSNESPDSAETISDEQAANVKSLIDECERTKGRRDKLTIDVCNHFKVDSLEMLPADKLALIVRRLELRRNTPEADRK